MEITISLTKYLSSCGAAARRKCVELVKSGAVSVNGQAVLEPGFKLTPGDRVDINGRQVLPSKKVYLMLNKPRGYVCTNDDPFADKKAIDLIDSPSRLFSAGRLDKESEGLLIFTNDGEYAEKLTHPRYQVLKTYLLEINYELPATTMQKLRHGILDDGEFLKPVEFDHIGERQYRVVLNEGKKREIRRLVAAANGRTTQLKRVAIGRLQLGDLPTGQYRTLSPEDIENSSRGGSQK